MSSSRPLYQARRDTTFPESPKTVFFKQENSENATKFGLELLYLRYAICESILLDQGKDSLIEKFLFAP